jgi:dUTP pyrophosphatase
MEEIKVHVVRQDGVVLPGYATTASSGMDLRAHIDQPVVLAPLERALVPTGIAVGIPEGYEGEVRPRSGLAINAGVTVLNAPGTVDADYRGEVKVILINLSKVPFEIKKGDRIAQIIFKRTVRASWEEVDGLSETERGEGGFGSTGRE